MTVPAASQARARGNIAGVDALLEGALAKALKDEAAAWDAFYSALDGKDIIHIRALMHCYLKASNARVELEESAGAASKEMEMRAGLHVRLSDRYRGLRSERFTIDR